MITMNSERDFIYEQIRSLSVIGANNILRIRSAEHDKHREEVKMMKDISDKGAAIKRHNAEE